MTLVPRRYMTSVLLNYSEVLEKQRTYAIFGTRRGGTSMVAGVARALGLDLGNVRQRKNNEDPRLQNRPTERMRQYVEERNAELDVWGWKFPGAGVYIPELSSTLRNPYFIIVYRDPVASALSGGKQDQEHNRRSARLRFHESAANGAVNTGLALATERPCLLVSHERAAQDPENLIDDLATFLGQMPPTGDLRERIIAYTEPGQYKPFDEFFGPDADTVAAVSAKERSSERPTRLLRRLRGDSLTARP